MVASNYSTIRLINSEDPIKGSFDINFSIDDILYNENKNNFDIEIKNLIKDDKKNIDLVLLLRCKISHATYFEIKKLHSKLSQYVAFWTFKDILSWYLDDDGKRFIRKKSNLIERLRKIDRIDFNYLGIERLINDFEQLKIVYFENKKNFSDNNSIKEIPRILPFSLKVIYTFDTEKNTKISTWVKRLIITDNYLKKQIYPYSKLIFTNKYTTLIKTSDEEIINAWQKCRKSQDLNIDSIKKILKDFREDYNKEKKRNYSLDKKSEIIEELANVLNQGILPQYFHPRNNPDDQRSIIKIIDDRYDSDDKYESDEKSEEKLSYFLKKWSKSKAKIILKEIIEKDMKKWPKDPGREAAWIYFSEINLNSPYKNNEFSEIASKCKSKKGLMQKVSWLSKLIRCEFVARKVWEYIQNKLKDITINYLEDPEAFTKNFEKKEGLRIASSSLKFIIEKLYLGENKSSWGAFQHLTIFDYHKEINDFKIYNDLHSFIFKYINPKKSRKTILIKLANEILREKGIIK